MRDGSGRETFYYIFVKFFDFWNPWTFYLFLKSIIFLASHPWVPVFCCLLPLKTKLPDSAVKSGTSRCHHYSLAATYHPIKTVLTEVARDYGLSGSTNSFSVLSLLGLSSQQTTLPPSSHSQPSGPMPHPPLGFLSALLVASFVTFKDHWGRNQGVTSDSLLSFHIQAITISPDLPLNSSHARPLVSTALAFMGC